jgi:CRP-like cAMP-binding protein
MANTGLGTDYTTGDVILKQGDVTGDLHVIQQGKVEIVHDRDGTEVRLTTLGPTDFFGEIPFFERVKEPGVARGTVRALESTRVLTVDRKTIVRRIHEDPSLAYKIMETMSRRVRELETEMVRLLTDPGGD